MNRRHLLLAAGASALAVQPAAAQSSPAPVDVGGVKYAPTVTVAGTPLTLNGAGIRFRLVVRVYTAGLYLTARASTPEQILATPGPKRLHVVMLREIDATELGKLFTRGMQDNSPRDEFSKSIPGTIRMAEIFSTKKRLAVGESFSVDWEPGTGTTVSINGRPQGEPIREPEFFSALMRIWLGNNPADAALKDALLGVARAANSGGNPQQ